MRPNQDVGGNGDPGQLTPGNTMSLILSRSTTRNMAFLTIGLSKGALVQFSSITEVAAKPARKPAPMPLSFISPTANTIFHKSSTPLTSWFHAIFLMASTRTGRSAKDLEREIGVTYKTALRMLAQIRKLMAQDDILLCGEVEVDETYIGGKHPKKRGRGAEGKTIVAGMVERRGRAIVKVVPDVKARTLLLMIQEHVLPGATVYTDELPSYNRLSSLGYDHQSLRHRARQYVAGNAHINSVEGFWGNFKQSINGVHHAVSPKDLQAYLDSYVFCFNHRFDDTPMFLQLLAKAAPAVPVRRGG